MTGNVNLPNVRKIGYSAFHNASALTGDIYLPSVEIIGSNAFNGCKGIDGGITIPQATHIGNNAFEECRNASGRLVMADVLTVGEKAFHNCVNLAGDIYMLNAVTIGDYAFYHCKLITGAPLFPCAKTIGKYAFNGCTGLTGEPSLGNLVNLGDMAFGGCTGLTGTVNLPHVIGAVEAFSSCKGIENVVLNSNVHTIYFSECTSLKSITGTENVRNVQGFRNCTSLTGISLPKCEYLGSFEGCTSLKSVEVSRNLRGVANYVFSDCTSLESFVYPSDCYINSKYIPSSCIRSQYSGDDPTGITLSGKSYAVVSDIFTLNKNVIPADAKHHITSWSSDNTSVAQVSSTGVISCVAPGTATITAETLNGHIGTHTITVTDSVTFTPEQTEYTIYTEDTQDITVYMTSPYYDNYDARWTVNSGSTLFTGETAVDYVDGRYALTAKYYGGMGCYKLVLRVGLSAQEIKINTIDKQPSRENTFTKDYISTSLSEGTLMVAGFDDNGQLLKLEIIDGYESDLTGFDDCAYIRAYQWNDLQGMSQLNSYKEIKIKTE